MAPELWYPLTEPTSRGAGFHSPFGGTWPDLADAARWCDGMQQIGVLTDDDAQRFRFWIEHGYVSLPNAVPLAAVDALNEAIEYMWRDPASVQDVYAETYDGVLRIERVRSDIRAAPHKVLDLHTQLPAAEPVVFAPDILRFLKLLFLRPPMAFQSLYFTVGTRQHMHQDTAYVPVNSPLEFAGVWIALEDVRPGTGELQYFDGSHRIPEYLFDGKYRSKRSDDPNDEPFLRFVYERSVEAGCELVKFLPKKGDALIWHANLVHGGSQDVAAGATRRSIVTHFCPRDVMPGYFRDGVPHSQITTAAGGAAYRCNWRHDG